MTSRRSRTCTFVLTVVAMVLAGCAQACSSAPIAADSNAGQASASGAATATPGSATTTAPPTAAPTALPTECAGGTHDLTVAPNENTLSMCLLVGGTLRVGTPQSPLQPWQPMTTSNSHVLACTSTPEPGGAVSAVCHAQSPGEATLTATNNAFTGDPHGPPQRLWQLTVRVQP